MKDKDDMMLKNAKARAAKFKGKRVKIDYDKILYGVSKKGGKN